MIYISSMEVSRKFHRTMEMLQLRHFLSYKELKLLLAQQLGRTYIPNATLSRWMMHLHYEKGSPGVKRRWEEEDLYALTVFGRLLNEGWLAKEAQKETVRLVENRRKSWH